MTISGKCLALIGAALLAGFLGVLASTCSGCYAGSPPWPYDPTQPAGPFPSRTYEVLPVYDGGTDLAMPPLPANPPRFSVWCNR